MHPKNANSFPPFLFLIDRKCWHMIHTDHLMQWSHQLGLNVGGRAVLVR